MTFDICPICDGSGERDFLSGAKCYECNGLGVIEDSDPDDEEYEDEFHVLDPEESKPNNDDQRELTGMVFDSDPDSFDDGTVYVSPEEQKRNDAMERGDYLRDRAKDERHGT